MPLNTRDLFLVLRAQDLTTRALGTFARNVRNAGNSVAIAQMQAQKAAALGQIAQARLSTQFQRAAIAQQMAARAAVMHGIATRNNTIQTQRASIAQLAAQRAQILNTAATLRATGGLVANTSGLQAQARAIQADINQRRAVIAGLQSEIAALRGNVVAMNQSINARRAMIATNQRLIASQAANIRNINGQIAQQQALNSAAQAQQRNLARMSQSMQRVGQTATSMGVAFTAAGALVAYGLKKSIDTAVAYEKQVRLTATQVDGFTGNLEELASIGRRVADSIAVPFEQIQPALFDIFSSMEVGVEDAEKLLFSFSKAAVAGQVDIQDVSRATIGLLNAFQRPVSDVNKLLDVQFQLVQEGVGTYEEWNQRIGLVTPSAVRAGQSIEVMMAALAASTRMGMSAARSGTAVARAFDALSNPKTVANLRALGVEAQDAQGKFRPFNEVLREFRTALMKLPEKDRLAKLLSVFSGAGGTIEARRFLQNMLLGAGNLELFDNILKETENSAGSMEKAYTLMADSAAANSQMLSNQWNLMKESLGKALIPTFAAIVGWMARLVGAFNELSPRTKQITAYVLALFAAFGLIMGPLLLIVGLIAAIVASFVIAGAAISIVIGALFAFVAIAAAAVAMFVLLWQKSEGFRTVIAAVGEHFKNVVGLMTGFAKSVGDSFKAHLEGPLNRLWAIIEAKVLPALLELYKMYTSTLLPKVEEAGRIIGGLIDHGFKRLGEVIDSYLIPAIEKATEFWNKHKEEIQPFLNLLGQLVKWFLIIAAVIVGVVVAALVGVFAAAIAAVIAIVLTLVATAYLLWNGLKWVWEQIKTFAVWIADVFVSAWNSLVSGIMSALDWIASLWGSFSNWLRDAWKQFWESDIGGLLIAIWNLIVAIVQLGFTTIQFIFAWAWEFIKSTWKAIWGGVVEDFNFYWGLITAAAQAVWSWLTGIWNSIWAVIGDEVKFVWAMIAGWLITNWNGIVSTAKSIWNGIVSFFSGLWNDIRGGAVSTWNAVSNAVSSGLNAAWNFIVSWGDRIHDFFNALPGQLYRAGRDIIQGLINGITSQIEQVTGAIHRVTDAIADALPGSPVKTGPLRVLNNGYAGGQIVKMVAEGMNAEMGRLQVSASMMGGSVMTGFGSSLASTSPNYGATTVVQNITVNTQEIDPRKNSAELGFELVKVL